MGIKLNPLTGQFDLTGKPGSGGTVTNVTASGSLTSSGGTTPNISFTGLTVDGVLYAASSSSVSTTSVGTAGQILASNGAGLAPSFQDAATLTGPSWSTASFGLTSTGTPPTFTTPTVDKLNYAINGKVMHIIGNWHKNTSSSDGTGAYEFLIPGGKTIDTNIVELGNATVNTGMPGTEIGWWWIQSSSGTTIFRGSLFAIDSTHLAMYFGMSADQEPATSVNIIGGTGYGLGVSLITYIHIHATVPIL